MRVRLLSFGPLKHLFPAGGRVLELPPGTDVEAVLDRLRSEGASAASLQGAAVAVNQEYVRRSVQLRDGDEVAILPPVSGGVDESDANVALIRDMIDGERWLRSLKQGEDGAVVVFDGIVRNNTRGRETLHLDYEAYEEMALEKLRSLRTSTLEKFAVREVAIVHRLGRLRVGETSVWIGVASAHRGAAFEACRWAIDTLKTTVPIWKHEQFVDGGMWVAGEPFPQSVLEPRV